MQAPKAALVPNQLVSAAMSDSTTRAAPAAAGQPGGVDPAGAGLLPILSVLGAAGMAVLALLASRSSDPLLLTVLAALAMLGLFFMLALAAGHVRLGEQANVGEIVASAADQIADALILTRADGSLAYANEAAARMLGGAVRQRAASIEAILAGIPGASEPAYRLLRAAARGDSASEELAPPSVGKHGAEKTDAAAERLLRVSVRPVTLPGQDRGTLWQVSDVSAERSRQAAAVAELQARLTDYERSAVGLVTVSADGTVQGVSERLLAMLGVVASSGQRPDVRAAAPQRIEHMLAADAVPLLWAQARREGAAASGLDLDIKRADGRLKPVRLVPSLHGEAGPDERLVLAVLDRAEAEEATPSAGLDVRFARFFQSAPFGIATVSAEGVIASANAGFARMILDDTSGIDRAVAEVLCRQATAETRKALDAALAEALAGRVPPAPVEITFGPKGEYVRRVFLHPFARSPNAREAALVYVVDATEEKALAAKFAQSQKMDAIGKLVGGIAHDFNNMLTAIIGFSDMLLQQHRASDPAHKDLMNIKKSAVRAAEIVAKLLAMSRQRTLQVEPLLLDEVVTDFAPFIKRAIGETIELKVANGRDIWHVKTDKVEMEQAILNLAVNARDAMPEGGTLSIRTYNVSERDSQKLDLDGMTVGEYVAIEVSDTGTGMPPEVMKRIFEPYFTTKAVGKGTGLGLASVMGTLKQCGGYIYPDSTPGKGTTFRLYLPRIHVEPEELQAAKAARAKEVPAADITGSGRVLLVEDEDLVRSFAVRALKGRGYEVLEASDGREALEVMAAHKGQVDIVVSDVVMPEMDGPTLLKELRKDNPDLKFIFVSGYPNENFKAAVGDNAKFAFLPKPFSLPQLAAKVKEELGR